MNLTPKQRRIRRQQIDDAKKCLARWMDVQSRMIPGTLTHNKATDEVAKAQWHLMNLRGQPE